MGVVYKARDLKLGRIVAIKTIAEGRQATVEQRERFRAEAQAVARLRHPNIIAIYAIDEHEDRPHLSLEYAEGGSLAQRLAERPMAARDAAALVETLARAIHAAHEAGVVHRDLKPSNVLLTAENVPKVSDFGLAKLLDAGSERTASYQVMGSPSYMSPEQAEGHSRQVGPPADVYSLGAILYQSLTGRPPFVGESALETLKLVSTTEVVAPRLLRPDVPRDLETICLKCLEKEPARRYKSAEALADDLRRSLDDRPIAARPVGPAGRLVRWSRTQPLGGGTFRRSPGKPAARHHRKHLARGPGDPRRVRDPTTAEQGGTRGRPVQGCGRVPSKGYARASQRGQSGHARVHAGSQFGGPHGPRSRGREDRRTIQGSAAR